ncbi:MAG: Hsp20 family protein [Tissierellia bacterium]|nr:Hsp20 family protein [Tissierellia bacterium]
MANIKRYNGANSINRGFNDFYNMMDNFFTDSFMPSKISEGETFPINVSELDKKYEIIAEIPGVEKEDINIEVEDGKISIDVAKNESLDKSDEEKNYIHREIKTSRKRRVLYFENIDEDNLEARLENGILKIDIPKKENSEKVKKVEIK